jgi:predicted RNA-binding Zn-ribbon protein involved in translation (DUF1610 family)
MPVCPECGKHLVRIHRDRLDKIYYSAVYRCHNCGFRTAQLYSSLALLVRSIFSRYTRCTRCGTEFVKRIGRRDKIDFRSMHPFSWIQGLLFAPLNKCEACRLQYHDWRPLSPKARGH